MVTKNTTACGSQLKTANGNFEHATAVLKNAP